MVYKTCRPMSHTIYLCSSHIHTNSLLICTRMFQLLPRSRPIWFYAIVAVSQSCVLYCSELSLCSMQQRARSLHTHLDRMVKALASHGCGSSLTNLPVGAGGAKNGARELSEAGRWFHCVAQIGAVDCRAGIKTELWDVRLRNLWTVNRLNRDTALIQFLFSPVFNYRVRVVRCQ